MPDWPIRMGVSSISRRQKEIKEGSCRSFTFKIIRALFLPENVSSGLSRDACSSKQNLYNFQVKYDLSFLRLYETSYETINSIVQFVKLKEIDHLFL